MASAGASKSSFKRSSQKFAPSEASNLSLDDSDASEATPDLNLNGNSCVNTPSPSSITSASAFGRPFKPRQNNYRSQIFSKRRYLHDRLFHHTQSLNRQYVIAMTNILFQMQKEIYKLKKRTHHMEQQLAKQSQTAQPVIRIPRLTPDEISTICVKKNGKKQKTTAELFERNQSINDVSSVATNSIDSSNEQNDDTRSFITSRREDRFSLDALHQQQTPLYKYCPLCHREFSHRSGYVRHVKNVHKGIPPSPSDSVLTGQPNRRRTQTTSFCTDPPSVKNAEDEHGTESESLNLLVNHWDIGEGRLRPRPPPKPVNHPKNKVKCKSCNKYYRVEYIKRHKRCSHLNPEASSSTAANDASSPVQHVAEAPEDHIEPISNGTSVDQIQPGSIEAPTDDTNPPSMMAIAEMDVDDLPIEFRRHPSHGIVIATTCLDPYQSTFIDEFLHKFAPQVRQTNVIDSQTTHLITNDDDYHLRSPSSMRLIEAVANHCFCVSYRWVIDCLKYDRIVDETRFEIEGDDADCQLYGGPKRSRLSDERHALFKNVCFMIKCTENNDIKLSNDHLGQLITTCGGQIISCVTQKLLDQYKIVVLCDKLYVSERRHNYDQCRSLGINFVSSQWVLRSIFEYRQKPFTSYEEVPL